MTREELAQQLKDVAEMLEKPSSFNGPDGPDIDAFVGAVLGSTDKYTAKEAVSEFIHQFERRGALPTFESVLRDSGWAKIGEEVPIGAVVNAIAATPPIGMKEVCSKLVDQLINHDSNVNSAFFEALAEHSIYEEGEEQFAEAAKEWAEEHGYIEKESDSFDDAAREWAEDNDWVDTSSTSFDDMASKYYDSDIKEFVIDYVTRNL